MSYAIIQSISKQVNMEFQNQLDLAIKTAHEAGELLLEGFYKEKSIQQKSSAVDWVTEYDQKSEKLIVDRLISRNPDHGVLGEEGSRIDGSSGFNWIIDPLDATNNFAHRFPIYAVSIALYDQDNPLVGVVYDPMRKETFTAIRGAGAKLSTPEGEIKLQVSDTKELKQSLLATGFPYDRHTSEENNIGEMGAFIRSAQGVRRPGCAALDMVYVAAGRLDGYWELKIFIWDMAAARLIVEEAGGRVSDPAGGNLHMDEKLSVVMSNGYIHEQMLDVIKKAQDR
jgi:myo-inositol-1(or 4)-monophosphatase